MKITYSIGFGDYAVTIPARVEGGSVIADVNANQLGGWFSCERGQVLGQTEEAGGEIAHTWEANDGQPRYWPAP